MNATGKTIDWVDYAAAHPFFIPLWAAVFGWMVETFAIGFYWMIPLFFFALWFSGYLETAPRLFEHYSRITKGKEALPCIQPAKI